MSINFKKIEDSLKAEAKKLLEEGKVSGLLWLRQGYGIVASTLLTGRLTAGSYTTS